MSFYFETGATTEELLRSGCRQNSFSFFSRFSVRKVCFLPPPSIGSLVYLSHYKKRKEKKRKRERERKCGWSNPPSATLTARLFFPKLEPPLFGVYIYSPGYIAIRLEDGIYSSYCVSVCLWPYKPSLVVAVAVVEVKFQLLQS